MGGAVLLYVVGAFVLGYPELVVMAAGGVIALIGALLWTLPRARLSVGREVTPLKVSRGEAAVAVLTVRNHGRLPLAGLRARDRVGASERVVGLPPLRGGRTRVVSYALPTDVRGVIEVGPLAVVREDPFGLTRHVTGYGEESRLLVRPRVVPLGVLPSGRAHHLEGPAGDRAPSGTATFHTLREYVPGDDLRHVHWRSTARTGTLMVRRLVDAGLPFTTVALDNRGSPGRRGAAGAGTRADEEVSGFELAVDVAASVTVGAVRAGFPVRVVTADGVLLDLKGGAGDAEVVLDALALVRIRDEDAATVDPLRLARPGGSLVVVTAAPTAARGRNAGMVAGSETNTVAEREASTVAAARRRHDRTLWLRVTSPGDPLRPPGGAVPAVPGVAVIDVTDLDVLAATWPGARR
ncbi:hypothetical protein Ssi03_11980 [Sphaerisporangium siamense]|uniref:Uncharacterized protein (DUF58 family) n=1 Tax=Sphaerisporangium siamense TaxID=795645 RepID=A0A7W7GC10_9ACTN|nr:DUF58 domain-containing protein [Sphaerisporangium siamense]MBB4703029.1 uncharacterized protein (DUF58 family) [Sphaerisporangium siamense]GII83208.1 hypothetical protein Ssi03_11980 [Sphaerisporangium siamense]